MADPEVVVIDYEAGNLRSVETALKFLKADFTITRHPERMRKAGRLIVPGVGEAKASMEALKRSGLDQGIRDFVLSGKPFLGICVGSQLIFTHSEERDTPCLGILEGRVKRFPSDLALKVPHMGWNQVFRLREHPVLSGIPDGAYFYFVHSYHPEPAGREQTISESHYGYPFASGVGAGNLVAFQFHPEKSGAMGLKLLDNFLRWNPS